MLSTCTQRHCEQEDQRLWLMFQVMCQDWTRAVWFQSLQSPLGRKLNWQKDPKLSLINFFCYQRNLIWWKGSQFQLRLNPLNHTRQRVGDPTFTNPDKIVLSCCVGENHKRVSSIEPGQSSQRTLATGAWGTGQGWGWANEMVICVLGCVPWHWELRASDSEVGSSQAI